MTRTTASQAALSAGLAAALRLRRPAVVSAVIEFLETLSDQSNEASSCCVISLAALPSAAIVRSQLCDLRPFREYMSD